MAFCSQCGNDVLDAERCSVCAASSDARNRAAPKRRAVLSACTCPRCGDALTQEDMEGTAALMCPACQGMFFPAAALEAVLNKLRATCDPTDAESALKDFKDRFRRELPDAVRYKQCPVCDAPMLRQNYGAVSGVITDVCNDHGTWVDGQAFAELADFIVRGGDLVADKAAQTRQRVAANRTTTPS
jgi:Zn-finger nucleic acid-binding protein